MGGGTTDTVKGTQFKGGTALQAPTVRIHAECGLSCCWATAFWTGRLVMNHFCTDILLGRHVRHMYDNWS
jgi:hypothetical protein